MEVLWREGETRIAESVFGEIGRIGRRSRSCYGRVHKVHK